jgi:DMSO reductase anchor subunit
MRASAPAAKGEARSAWRAASMGEHAGPRPAALPGARCANGVAVNPAWSVVLFTTLAGAAQGLVVTLALAELAALPMSTGFLALALALAVLMLLAALGASTLHLGRPARAWRAVLMWRTSWLSREVIVLPAFIGVCALWWLALVQGWNQPWLPWAALVLAAALWLCTAMIYACIRFIQERAQPLTLVNFTLIGLSSGLVLACALAALFDQLALRQAAGPSALGVTLAAWATRMAALRHNARLRHRSTLQSATGWHAPKLVQTSMGMTGGAFNTREFFHGRTPALLRTLRYAFLVFGFALPALLLAWGLASPALWPWLLAPAVQMPGLLAERWFFLAQAQHPQNLYYQVVS